MRLPSPAKLNLFLAITGRRSDGFHELVSLVSLVEWGDTLEVELTDGADFSLSCDHPDVPVDGSNLVLRAAHAFRSATGISQGARFNLSKRIPVGAGLGGGSGNAITALRGLNSLHNNPLSEAALEPIAASLGSDCVLFLRGEPQVMRGRGEHVTRVTPAAAQKLHGQRVLIFKPPFGISTAWAYREMAATAPRDYLPAEEAERRLAAWMQDPQSWGSLLFNNMESVAFRKFVALPVLLTTLRERHGLICGMSGSGSACFAMLDDLTDVEPILASIRECWGKETHAIQTKIS